jgi:hypothetical protein
MIGGDRLPLDPLGALTRSRRPELAKGLRPLSLITAAARLMVALPLNSRGTFNRFNPFNPSDS